MLLELIHFVFFLLLLVLLCAAFHQAFLDQTNEVSQRVWEAFKLLLCAGGISLVSGYIFSLLEQKASRQRHRSSILATFPVRVFLSTAVGLSILFTVTWAIETFFLPWARVR